MTSFDVRRFDFKESGLESAVNIYGKLWNWPIVYILHGSKRIYIGETLSARKRIEQHLHSKSNLGLDTVQVVLDDSFNKSACLDLESYLIRLFDGDAKYELLNLNQGIVDAQYFNREQYRSTFESIFNELRQLQLFTKSVPEIENSELFKLSPYTALNTEQGVAVNDIVRNLETDLALNASSLAVIQGEPGTGKSVVGIHLVKLLRDLSEFDESSEVERESMFSDFFLEGSRQLFQGLRIGMVIPQQAFRKSVKNVFRKSRSMRNVEVLTAFDVGDDEQEFDVLIVDEAHRLTQYAAQSHGTLTARFKRITENLFGSVDEDISQLDWLRKKSKHLILLLDKAQKIRPADIDTNQVEKVLCEAKHDGRLYSLEQQMRVKGGNAYIKFVRNFFSQDCSYGYEDFGDYDVKLFDNFSEMREAIVEKDREFGLSRLVAGYAWPWVSRKDSSKPDIVLDGVGIQWNKSDTDWISSKSSVNEMGSIHTIQGYDLNYAGVVIGNDISIDPESGDITINRNNYYDIKGKSNNTMRKKVTSDDDLLEYITNIYSVLLTRGILGTYIYVVDRRLRERLRNALTQVRK